MRASGLALPVVAALGCGVVSLNVTDPAALASDAKAPELVLPSHESKQVALSEQLTKGDVVLVFYRGHW
jgi:hypothetical protein